MVAKSVCVSVSDTAYVAFRLAVALVWRAVAEARLALIPVGGGGVCSEGRLWGLVWPVLCAGGWRYGEPSGGQIWQVSLEPFFITCLPHPSFFFYII